MADLVRTVGLSPGAIGIQPSVVNVNALISGRTLYVEGTDRVDNLVVVANLSVTAHTELRYSAREWTIDSNVMRSCR